MNDEANKRTPEPSVGTEGRRELLERFSKLGACAAPFTVLALVHPK
jgi:hypothetical protein